MARVEAGVKVFAGPRGSGRTTALLKWALEDPAGRRIVVLDDIRKRFLEGRPDSYGIGIWTHHYVNIRGWKSYVVLGVDDFDEFLAQEKPIANGFGHQVRAIVLESENYINIARPKLPPATLQGVNEELNTILNNTQA